MTSRFFSTFLAVCGFHAASSGYAQTMLDPASVTGGRTRLAPVLSISNVDYERENGSILNIDRKTLGVEWSHGFAKTLDGVATLGVALDSDASGLPKDDGGFSLGVGGRGVVYRQGTAGVVVYGFLNWLQDIFRGTGGYSEELRTYDLRLGGTFSVAVEGRFQPYCGLDLVLLRGGSETVKTGAGAFKSDLQKDNVLALKLGINILVKSVMLRPEVTLLGEQTLTFAAGFPL